jgi:hypothetical protein
VSGRSHFLRKGEALYQARKRQRETEEQRQDREERQLRGRGFIPSERCPHGFADVYSCPGCSEEIDRARKEEPDL